MTSVETVTWMIAVSVAVLVSLIVIALALAAAAAVGRVRQRTAYHRMTPAERRQWRAAHHPRDMEGPRHA